MEGSSDAIVTVQSQVLDAMDKLNGGDMYTALQKFEETIEDCKRLIPVYSGANLAALETIRERCTLQANQIHQYIESDDNIHLTESQKQESGGSYMFRESEFGDTSMLSHFPQLSNTEPIIGEIIIDNYWRGYLWDKVDSLLNLLQPHTNQLLQKFQPEVIPTKREEITLDSSFILLPKEGSGQRVLLSEPVKKVQDPEEKIKELESKCTLLKNQLEQMKKINQPQGVTNLMNENTKLKRSIIDFTKHVQKHNLEFRKTQLSHGDSLLSGTPKEMEVQIRELILKVAILEKENLKKDQEIKELLSYKEKWLNLKKEASVRKKQRESFTGTIEVSDDSRTIDKI